MNLLPLRYLAVTNRLVLKMALQSLLVNEMVQLRACSSATVVLCFLPSRTNNIVNRNPARSAIVEGVVEKLRKKL